LQNIVVECGILVRDNTMWNEMKFEDIIDENLSHSGCGEGMLQRIEIIIFGKMINHHHDDYLGVVFM